MISDLSWSAFGVIVSTVLVVSTFVWAVAFRNRIVRLGNVIDNAWAQVDVQLKRRADLIPNIVETVKGYASHERGVLETVVEARSGLMRASTEREADSANGMLSLALGRLMAVVEAYPDLKANANFLALQRDLVQVEDAISFSRQTYNGNVLNFNNVVTTFPGEWFAKKLGVSKRPMLAVEAKDRDLPRVSFAA